MGAAALMDLLEELAGVVAGLAPSDYVAEPLPGVSGSVGAHVRHALDHVAALVEADGHRVLTYDVRHRGTEVECSPAAALERIAELEEALARFDRESPLEPIETSALVDRSMPPVVAWSTRARELAFVVSHTVHHHAIIRILLASLGVRTGDAFGYAASTPVAVSA